MDAEPETAIEYMVGRETQLLPINAKKEEHIGIMSNHGPRDIRPPYNVDAINEIAPSTAPTASGATIALGPVKRLWRSEPSDLRDPQHSAICHGLPGVMNIFDSIKSRKWLPFETWHCHGSNFHLC